MICPHCGHETSPKRSKARPVHPGPEASDRAIHAYYKAIAPTENLRFTRRHASPELQAEIDRLLAGQPTAKDATRICEKRRIEMVEAARREHVGVKPECYMVALGVKGSDRFATACPISMPAAEFEALWARVVANWQGGY